MQKDTFDHLGKTGGAIVGAKPTALGLAATSIEGLPPRHGVDTTSSGRTSFPSPQGPVFGSTRGANFRVSLVSDHSSMCKRSPCVFFSLYSPKIRDVFAALIFSVLENKNLGVHYYFYKRISNRVMENKA